MTESPLPTPMVDVSKIARDIEVDAARLAAVALVVATEETRYYLHGVSIEPCAAGGATMTATDGHRLISVRDPDGRTNGRFICPFPAWLRDHMARIESDEDEDDGPFTFVAAATKVRFVGDEVAVYDVGRSDKAEHKIAAADIPPIDGKYPDWRKTVVGAPVRQGATLYLDPEKLTAFATAARLLTHFATGPVRLVLSEADKPVTILIEGYSDFYGVLMPCRHKGKVATATPEWIAA